VFVAQPVDMGQHVYVFVCICSPTLACHGSLLSLLI